MTDEQPKVVPPSVALVKATAKSANTAIRATLDILSIAGQEERDLLNSSFWRVFLVIFCIAGSLVNVVIVCNGTGLLLVVDPVPQLAIMLLACFPVLILFLSKQIWTDRLGGGTFLFILFLILWFVCLAFNVSAVYWVYKVSFRLQIPENVQHQIATYMREILPFGAAAITSIPPMLLGILMFPRLGSDDTSNGGTGKKPAIDIELNHGESTPAELKQRVEELARRSEKLYSIEWVLDDGILRFRGTAGGARGVSGLLVITDIRIHLILELPASLMPFRKAIKQAAWDKLRVLAPQSTPISFQGKPPKILGDPLGEVTG